LNRIDQPRLLHWFLAGAALFALLGVIVSLALMSWITSIDRRLDGDWRRGLGGASFPERYPAAEDNATVHDLEKLGAAVGIDMAPPDTPGRVHPTPKAAKRFEAVQAPLKAFYSAYRISTDDTPTPVSPELAAFLESIRPGLDAIRSRLAKGPPPVWKRDLDAGFETKVPNYLGLLTLQKLFLLDAAEQLRARRETQAGEILDASWRLNQAMSDNNPSLITQLIAQAVIRLQQPILRGFPRAPAGWPERLRHLDLQSRILLGLRCEAFGAHRAASLDQGISGIKPRPRKLARLAIWDYARRLSDILDDLPRQDVRTFDPDAFNRQKLKSIPRWQTVARLLLPNFWDSWPKSAHVELEAELTALIFEERNRLATGGPPRPANRRASRVKGLSWVYEDLQGDTVLHLDGDLRFRELKPVPLRFTVYSEAEQPPGLQRAG
jgi:hypothetical protein